MKAKLKFKQTEIGMIPEDWEITTIQNKLALLKDGTHNPPKRVLRGIRFIAGASDIKYKNIDFSNCTFISEEEYKKIHKFYELKEGDVLLTIVGTVGNVAIIKKEDLPFSLQRSIAILRPKKELNNTYLFYFLTSNIFRNQMFSKINPTAQPGIYLGELGKIVIVLPKSLEEQSAIASILSSLDSKIELNQQMNKTLEAIGQAIFKRWFVDFEFPNEKGKPYKSSGGEMVDSELGKIPKGWSVKELPEIALVIDCLHTKKPEQTEQGKVLLQFYNLNEIHNVNLSNPYFVSDGDYEKWAKNIEVSNGDILFTNAARQAIAKVPYWFKGGIGRNITAVRSKIDPAYLLEYFLSEYGREQISKNTDQGTIFSSLNVKGIKQLKILTPLNEIIKLYSNIAGKLRFKIEVNEAESANLSQIRDSLLPKLMSGKIRVPVEVAA